MSAVYEKLVDLLVNHFAVERAQIRPDATFDELDMDSLFVVELLLVIQSEFEVEIQDDAVGRADSIGRLAGIVEDGIGVAP